MVFAVCGINRIYETMLKRIIICGVTLLLTAWMLGAQQPVQICAHRGFWKSESAGKAQNSIASLKAAQDNGFWGSEFDVHLTSDGVVVVNHDPVFHLTNVQTHTYSQLTRKGKLSNGETLPTLDQFNLQGINQFKWGIIIKKTFSI